MQTAVVRLIAWVAVPWACLGLRPAVGAGEPAKLKTQVVTLKVAADKPRPERAPAIELVQLPAGKITLKGADGRDHEHEVKPIWMAQYETRWDEYDVFWMGLDLTAHQRDEEEQASDDGRSRWDVVRVRRPYVWPDEGPDWQSPGRSGFPANSVGFRAARKYCAWLSKHTGKKFRLPTEAEWEYACRAGGPPARPDAKALDAVAWFAGNSEGTNHPVGRKRPNAWGLYDMLGNVGEYVIRDPTDEKGLLAGGSYKDPADKVHCAAREPYSPDWQKRDPEDPPNPDWLYWEVHHAGFRVVMEE